MISSKITYEVDVRHDDGKEDTIVITKALGDHPDTEQWYKELFRTIHDLGFPVVTSDFTRNDHHYPEKEGVTPPPVQTVLIKESDLYIAINVRRSAIKPVVLKYATDVYAFTINALKGRNGITFEANSVQVTVLPGDTILDVCLRMPVDKCWRSDWVERFLSSNLYRKNPEISSLASRAILYTLAHEVQPMLTVEAYKTFSYEERYKHSPDLELGSGDLFKSFTLYLTILATTDFIK